MKKIDKYFFDEKRIPNQGFKDYLFRFEEYKKLSLSSPMNYVLSLVFALGLVAVVILNDYRNAIIIATSIILSLVEVFIFSPLLNRKKKEIGELEDNIDSATCVEDFKEKINRLHRSVYRYSYADTISSYAIVLVMLAMVMLTMYLSGISSLPYIIFYTCICFALFKTTNQLFSFSDKVMEFNRVKIKISNRIKNHE